MLLNFSYNYITNTYQHLRSLCGRLPDLKNWVCRGSPHGHDIRVAIYSMISDADNMLAHKNKQVILKKIKIR